MRDDEPRLVWMSLLITHCVCVLLLQKSETVCVYCTHYKAVRSDLWICCRNSGNFLNLGKFRTF